MKKLAVFTILIVITLSCAFAFTACGSDAKLAMEKRYIHEADVGESNQRSYLFHSNGTGEYTFHYDSATTHSHYIIHFKYTYVDNDKSAVVCFYDSVEILQGNSSNPGKTWSNLVTVSKNVLTTVGSGYVFWINEDYLDEIPNFHA